MNRPVVQRILGLLLMVFSLTMLPPVVVSIGYADGSWVAFLEAFGIVLTAGFLIWLPVRNQRREMRLRDGFMVVALFWVGLGIAGAAPFIMSEAVVMSVTDAIFESMSGLTTTGATVFTGLDELPRAILYYRQQLQWLGGMGIIVLAVAVLPMLGVGGMQLYRAETPGPVKDTKLTPRITETAKALWYIYLGITVACGCSYWLAGMEPFDAVGHAFSTVAIGGFSTHDASIGFYASVKIELIATVFMFVSGVNFSLHFLTWRTGRPAIYWKDPEFRAYTLMLLFLTLAVVIYLLLTDVYETPGQAFTQGLFQTVSIATTTGYTISEYADWPRFLPVLLLLATFVGGCAGSTAGGMKVIRWLLIYKQGVREVVLLVHPSAAIPVKLENKAVPDRIVESVWGFFSIYIVVFGVMMMALMLTGLDQVSAFAAVAATLNNLGPGLGEVAQNFQSVDDLGKWLSMAAMLLGRLEIFTLLVLITPTYWRR